MSATQLTSRNIFDVVFASIPPDAGIDFGAHTSLRERMAMGDDASTSATHTASTRGDDDVLGSTTPAKNTNTMQLASMARQGTASHHQHRDDAVDASTWEVLMDEDDAAVQEARQYANVVSEMRALRASAEEAELMELQRSSSNATNHAHNTATSTSSSSSVRGGGRVRGDGARREADDDANNNNNNNGSSTSQQQPRRAAMTAEEQMQRMPPGAAAEYRGVCAMFRHSKAFGFIEAALGGPDIYFTRDGVELIFTRNVLRHWWLNHRNNNNDDDGCEGEEPHKMMPAVLMERTKEEPHAEEVVPPPPPTSSSSATTLADATEKPEEHPTTPQTTTMAEVPTSSRVGEMDERVLRAAALLTPAIAHLFLHQLECVGGTLTAREEVRFRVCRNKAARGNARQLRAEMIVGPPHLSGAVALERAWFAPVFSNNNKKSNNNNNNTTVGDEVAEVEHTSSSSSSSMLVPRFLGTVRAYAADEQRGYIRLDDDDSSHDLVFFRTCCLFDARVPVMKRNVAVGLRVEVSRGVMERQGRCVATLITGDDGHPLTLTTLAHMAEDSRAGAGATHKQHASGGGGGGGGARGNADGSSSLVAPLMLDDEDDHHHHHHGGGGVLAMDSAGGSRAEQRKRARDEADDDALLLLEDDGYVL